MRLKTLGTIICLLFFILILVGGIMLFNKCISSKRVMIVNKESFYSNYTIKENKVYIRCELTISNSMKEEIMVEFYASFPNDVKLGLLKKEQLKGYQENLETSEFSLPEGKKRISVIFVGEFAGTHQKNDRNLPEITIIQK